MRILWLKTAPLHPLDTGGKLRTYHMLRALCQRHEVTYLSLLPKGTPDEAVAGASEYSSTQLWIPHDQPHRRSARFAAGAALNALASRRPFVVDRYTCRDMTQAVDRHAVPDHADLLVCDFLAPSLNVLQARGTSPPGLSRWGEDWGNGRVRAPLPQSSPHCRKGSGGGGPPPDKHAAQVPCVLFQHNVESMIWERMVRSAGSRLKEAYLNSQWRRMCRYEREACAAFDAVIAVSAEDAAFMRDTYGLTNIAGHVPTGVDCDHFQTVTAERQADSIVFLGSMDWLPNVDAVEFFVAEVYGRIKAARPGVSLTIVGRNPPGSVNALAAADSSIRVTGTVPDVRPYLAEGAVFVVPLRVGGGTRIKIFEAMAAGIPVVSTRVGAEGLPVEHAKHLLLADEPQPLADAVTQILAAPAAARKMAARALALVRDEFSWDAATRVFEKLCDGVMAGD